MSASTTSNHAAVATPVAVSHWETTKAAVATFAVIVAFIVSGWPRELIALAVAAFLLINRQIPSTDMMKHVDGNLLLLLMGSFVVNAALAETPLPEQVLVNLRAAGLNLHEPLSLFLVTSVLSNLVANNPAVMLLVPYLGTGGKPDAIGAALALGHHAFVVAREKLPEERQGLVHRAGKMTGLAIKLAAMIVVFGRKEHGLEGELVRHDGPPHARTRPWTRASSA